MVKGNIIMQRIPDLDGGIKIGELVEVCVGHLPRVLPLRGNAQVQAVQLSDDLGFHLRVLRHHVPATQGNNCHYQKLHKIVSSLPLIAATVYKLQR